MIQMMKMRMMEWVQGNQYILPIWCPKMMLLLKRLVRQLFLRRSPPLLLPDRENVVVFLFGVGETRSLGYCVEILVWPLCLPLGSAGVFMGSSNEEEGLDAGHR